jgi:hypothetical protein
MGKWTTAVFLLSAVLGLATSASAQEDVCGDVNDNGQVTTSDALAVLRKSVGQPVELLCPPAGGIAATGQTVCFDSMGAGISCSGTGQDGEFQLGTTHALIDNGDGTVTDESTGLTWEKLSDDGSLHDKDNTYTWQNAVDTKIATLNAQSFGGHDDWRLPNRFELDSIVRLGANSPATYAAFATGCAPACTVTTCSCTRSDYYWTSTTYLASPIYAWTVYFSAGDTQASLKTQSYYVRAVRGGE